MPTKYILPTICKITAPELQSEVGKRSTKIPQINLLVIWQYGNNTETRFMTNYFIWSSANQRSHQRFSVSKSARHYSIKKNQNSEKEDKVSPFESKVRETYKVKALRHNTWRVSFSLSHSRSILLSFRRNSKADPHPKNDDRFMFYLDTLSLPDFTDNSIRFTKKTKSRRGDHPKWQKILMPQMLLSTTHWNANESKSCNIMCTGPQGRTGGGGGEGDLELLNSVFQTYMFHSLYYL